MKTKNSFNLKSDWNYLPTFQNTKAFEKKEVKSLPKYELEGLRYDDLRGLTWAILEEYD